MALVLVRTVFLYTDAAIAHELLTRQPWLEITLIILIHHWRAPDLHLE